MKARTAVDAGTRPERREAVTADAHEIARLKRALARRERELAQALARQTATAEVLQAISRSPTELQPVLDAVAQRAALLCRAQGSRVWLAEGDHLRAMTSYGPGYPESVLETRPIRATSVGGRAFLERRCVHVEDVVPLLDTEYPDSRELQSRNGYRTVLVVPMLREGQAIGLISLLRNEVRPFAPSEISLVQTFADQAVIAIENVRLFNETREALERQQASAEVLQVISGSVADTTPVFEKILDSCERLFAGRNVGINIVGEDGGLYLGAFRGPRRDELQRQYPVPLGESASGIAILERRVVHCPDVEAPGLPDFARRGSLIAGNRSALFAPMLWEGQGIGAIFVGRSSVGAFSEKEIALLKTFADQAVIAIQNARMFNALQARNLEVSQALEQQTATSDILQVIGSSMADATPVFEKILDSCQHLFGASDTGVFLVEGNELLHAAAWRGEFAAVVPGNYPRPLAGTMSEAVIRHGALRHWPNVLSSPDVPGYITEVARAHGDFSVAVAPLMRDGRGIGTLDVMRKPPRAFGAKELALLRSFADQAVIAILNARLFNETRQALEHQTATAEVLKVISESPTDVQPVFDAICERAMALSGANIGGVTRFDGEWVHLVAFQGISPEADAAMRAAFPMRPSRASISARAVLEGVPVEIADVEKDPDYELKPQMRLAGYRSNLSVPMLRDGKAIGSITVCRPEPGTFPRPLVELLQTFADQAVIAIENVRLFNELQARNREVSQALDQQTATSEILRVISSSPTDVQPVFDAIANAALVLCRARSANLLTYDGELLHQAARALVEPGTESAARGLFPRPAGTDTAAGRAVLTRRVAVIPDVFVDPDYAARDVARLTGARSFLGVPLLRDGHPVGAIAVGRPEPGAIPDQQIALLQTFADQAVIAIENVRLFNETKEALEQQIATAEILQVISESPTDVKPVFDAIAQRARRLCGGVMSGVALYDGRLVHMEAYDGATEQIRSSMYSHFPRAADRATMITRAIADARPVQMPDAQADPEYLFKGPSREGGIRSYIAVPMMREGRVVGSMSVGRREIGLFPDKQVQLLQTFADQAVIAIENVRLFNELREKGEQLELASRHKSQFLANMSHELRTPLNAIIGFTRIVMRRTKDQIEPKQAENLEKILASGQHLLALINAVLDLSKIEAGRVEVAPTEIELAPVLRQCVLTIEPLVKADAVSLVAELDGALPRMWVDEEKLRQIVINLLSNAAKFTASGSIRLGVQAEGENVRIAVTDTGFGIAADKLGLIFEEFEQADASSTRLYGGTGLGLAIARRLARLMGGEVEAESVPGRGSTFTLTLPLRDRAPAAA